MPGFFVSHDNISANASPQTAGPFGLANSFTGYNGDPVVWTNAVGSENRMRLLTGSDITAAYEVSSVVAGILGILPEDAATDSSGNVTTVPSTVSLAGGVKVNYPILSMAQLEPADPVSGRLRAQVKTLKNLIGGVLWQNTTATQALVGLPVGILLSTISGVGYYFWSTAATTKIGTIRYVDENNPYYDTVVTANVQDTTHYPRCPVVVAVNQDYNQLETQTVYTT